MAYPIWLTPAGNLGIVPEEEYYELALDAYDQAGGTLLYTFLSGTLPPGIQVNQTGKLQGVPVNTSGPDQNQTYTFTIRVQNQSDGGLADRSFSLTVTNIAPPIIIPRNVNLGIYFDGDVVNLQFNAIEFIPGANLTWSVKSGQLPPGLTLGPTGLLYGYIDPIVASGLAGMPGWDDTPWDDLGWQFPLGTTSKSFNFSIEVFDGVNYDVSNYKLLVLPKNSLTADGTIITVDTGSIHSGKLSVDTQPRHYPIITTVQTDFVPERQGDWFAQQIQAIDLDGDVLQYTIPLLAQGSFDAQTIIGNSVLYVDSIASMGNISTGLTSLINGQAIQVLYPYTDPIALTTTLTWYNATVNSYLTMAVVGNTIVSGTPGQFITQAFSNANATISNVSTTTGTITLGGNLLYANVGDTITQPTTGASATIISVLTTPYVLTVQYNFGTFHRGSGNLQINGQWPLISGNISNAYPASVNTITYISAQYNTASLFNFKSTSASALAYINGVNTFSFPNAVSSIGVTLSGSPNTQGAGFDSGFFDQGTLQLPGNLTIDANSGWITGYLPTQIANQSSYDFTVDVYKRDYNYYVASQLYTLTILGDLNNAVNWLTPSSLGYIENGAVSDIQVTALSTENKPIYYSLYQGPDTNFTRYFKARNINGYATTSTVAGITYSENWVRNTAQITVTYPAYTFPNTYSTKPDTTPYQKLPQGLELQPDGLISGRVSFEVFSLDSGLTTFDAATTATTFDHTYTFTVNASTVDQTASATQTFTLTVRELNIKPYENLYLKAYMSQYQRTQIQGILTNQAIFPRDLIYRSTDPYFGLAKDVKMLFLAGLNPSALSTYALAVSTNHFGKRLLFGNIKTAVARETNVYDVVQNSTGNVIGTYNVDSVVFVPNDFSLGYVVANAIPSGTTVTQQHIKYEVVYVDILDENSNAAGQGPIDSINLAGVISTPYYDQSGNTFVLATPNAFTNMQDAIVNNIGYANKGALPDWMTSVQPNGTQLGFTRAVVLAYTQPGASNTIAWRLQQQGIDLNQFDFTVDSYLLDNIYSADYDIVANAFVQSSETTFDRYPPLNNTYSHIGNVDYAVNTSFESINEKALVDIVGIGGLDGITSFIDGQTLVFYKQEFPTGTDISNSYNQGWANNTAPWDLEGMELWDGQQWDQSTYITGYEEWLSYAIPNQRIGIWRINVDSNDYVTLTFLQTVTYNQSLYVRNGYTHGGTNIYYDPIVKPGNLVPNYSAFKQQIKTVNTEFDGNGTLFYDYRDTYVVPEQGDTQIVFPKTNVFD